MGYNGLEVFDAQDDVQLLASVELIEVICAD